VKRREDNELMDDHIVRAVAGGGEVRCFAALTTQTVEEARRLHGTYPVASAALGRMLTAGAMMGCMLKGEKDRLTISIKGDGPLGGVVVTSGCDSYVKGYVFNPVVAIDTKPNGKLDVSGAIGRGELSVIKDMGLKEPYNGRVDLVSGEIAEDLTWYFATSEQTPGSVGLGVLVEADRDYEKNEDEDAPRHHHVRAAGGFIIQMMPGASEETIGVIERNLGQFSSVTTCLAMGETPEDILHRILDPLQLEITDRIPTGYRCDCSRERVLKALATLNKRELEDMAKDGSSVEVGCQFCNKKYSFKPEELL
jgi:molecular chaperone Hsp33